MLNTTEILIIAFGSMTTVILLGLCVKRHIKENMQRKIESFKKRVTKKRIKPILMMTDEELREECDRHEVRTQELTQENFV